MKLHQCSGELPSGPWGAALHKCYEDELGGLWVSNGEYTSAVNFCPYCGYAAPALVVAEPLSWDDEEEG
jgi:glycine/D-amino acid oxidase-like deaminating enzyme